MASAAVIGTNHIMATAITLILLLVIPEMAVVAIYVVLFAVAIVTNSDVGGPLALPAGMVVVAVFGIGSSLLAIVVGVTMDVVRRVLRLRCWTPPLMAAGVWLAGGVCVSALRGWVLGDIVRIGLLCGVIGGSLACIYWTPLIFSEQVWAWLRRFAGLVLRRMHGC